MSEPAVCIFPHSNNEFRDADSLRRFLRDDLRGSRDGRYLLRKIGWKSKDFGSRAVAGSLVLFGKNGLVVGEGSMASGILELDPPVEGNTATGEPAVYYHQVFFQPDTVRVYDMPYSALEAWADAMLGPRFYQVLGRRSDFESAFPSR